MHKHFYFYFKNLKEGCDYENVHSLHVRCQYVNEATVGARAPVNLSSQHQIEQILSHFFQALPILQS